MKSTRFLSALLPALLLSILPACRAPAPSPAPAPAAEPTAPGDALPDDSVIESTSDLLPEAELPEAELSHLYILRWNPDISSFTDATFREGFARLRTEGDARTNWSIRDWPDVRPGDWALFARVGGADPSTDGIAGLCRFLSPAYEGASWRGDGSTVHYADIDILLFNDPALSGLFTAEELALAFPAIDWHGGHSGILLDPETAEAVALHIADRLARLDSAATPIPPDALSAVPLAGDGLRAIACALLSRLCPDFRAALTSRPPSRTPAFAEPWLPEPGTDILYSPAPLPRGTTLLDASRFLPPELQIACLPAFTPDDAEFAATLLQAAADTSPDGNAIVSPLAADTLLSALAAGAGDSAADALLEHFGADASDFWQDRIDCNHLVISRNQLLLRTACDPARYGLDRSPVPQYAADAGLPPTSAPALELDSRLFLRTRDGLSPAYTDLFRPENLDIPILPVPPSLNLPATGNPLLALADFAFRARWKTPFDPADTAPSTFHAPDGDVTVPFMNRFGDIAVKKLPGTRWTSFTLPYAGCDLELLVLLPPRGATLDDLRSGLADALSAEWYTPDPVPAPAFLTMPRIDFTAAASAPDLISALGALDLATLSDPATTDLAAINPSAPPYLYALHQSIPFTAVESGTAPFPSNAPPSRDGETAQPGTAPRRLLLNRPFAFALRDPRTGLLLLLGRFVSP